MKPLTLQQLIPVIQTAVGPVILISGVGLLLLSLTNRYGRINDRGRMLIREMVTAGEGHRAQMMMQLNIIHRRARIIRFSILLATLSVLLAGLLIISLFVGALINAESAILVSLLFVLCIVALIASLLTFLIELQASLNAFHIELEHAINK
jgi:hypothetical protein